MDNIYGDVIVSTEYGGWSPSTCTLQAFFLVDCGPASRSTLCSSCLGLLLFILFYYILFYFIVVGFVIHWNESAMGLHVFPIPIPPPTSLSTRSLWVFPVHQVRALVSCIQPGLMICFTLDNIHVSMLFSWNIPPSPSPTESKRLFYGIKLIKRN